VTQSPPAERSRSAPVHPVIAGYDGSASARNALAYAAGLARKLGRPLLVLHVTLVLAFPGPMTGEVVTLLTDTERIEKWLHSELDEVADRSGMDVFVHARQGSAGRQLMAAVIEYSADALVIGASAGSSPFLPGSLPAWLVKRARCPVIVVP
jgi:nucleotide-binding universal stress UspA family protein